jgi:hypothetical protein
LPTISRFTGTVIGYSENTKLATWVQTQRSQNKLHRQGKPSPISASRIRALESLGFEWDSRGAAWTDLFNELADYQKIHGHCNVPKGYGGNRKLSEWVAYQRRHYKLHLKGETSSMTPFRIQALESLGFEWKSTIKISPIFDRR